MTVQVSPPVHRAVHTLATQLGTSADGALQAVLDPCTIRVRVSGGQYERWHAYASAAGIPLDKWIEHRVEAAIQYGTDQGTMAEVLKHVRTLVQRTAVPRAKTKPKESP